MTGWKEDYRQAWRNIVETLWTNRTRQQRTEMVMSMPILLLTDGLFVFKLIIPLVKMVPPSYSGMSPWIPAELGLAIIGTLWAMLKVGYLEMFLIGKIVRRLT